VSRRIVLLHASGPYAGLYQIMGTDDGLPSLPSVVESVTYLDGHIGSAVLAAIEPRYALYREVSV
jgi:hypothetical protein